MELKVWVDGVQRVVCGVNEKTTCQEVVIALAQAMGRTGRYTLKEKWKDIERHFTPEEKLLPSLSKWGQKTKDVQLILNRTGPSLNLRPVSDKHRPERNIHRQSLPPLAKLRNKSDKNSHVKEAKRKSLNFAEGAREWLGSFGKSKEGKVKGKGGEPEKEASNSDHRPGGELNQLLQRQQEKLTSLQAELEASEAEIAKLQEDSEPSTHTEIIRIQELIDERSAEAEEVEFWENELKAEQLHGGELREQLKEVKEKLEECEEKLRNCLLKAQGLAADLEVVRSQREQQEAKSCHDIRIKRKRCELEDLTRELRQVNLLQFIQQTGTKVSILPAQEGPAQVIESQLHQNSPENEILPAKAKVLQYLMVSSFNREGIYV
ncbi:ras association domain-containing protein 8-like isoform X2 [Chiloscyllium plagiosum]|uniref:ras association domain-containing protein 8-like isoform X2 n=1 Tax=Chiloscyllium plagiosum TaxID=36176 RepID=UPI001CB7D6DD|nr:ras association domain-containing protein 8-like isoform X2 [Chiloscyllium plagiosum]